MGRVIAGIAERFEEDFFERIVNVKWSIAGGIFVAAGSNAFTVTTKISDPKDEIVFQELGELGFTSKEQFAGAVNAVGYYKYPGRERGGGEIGGEVGSKNDPIFVLGGCKAGTNGNHWVDAVVMYSRDGKSFNTGFDKHYGDWYANDSEVMNFALDGETFYGNAYSHEFYFQPETQVNYYDLLLSSSDGSSWSEAGKLLRWNSEGNPPPNLSPPSMFMPHINPKTKLPEGKAVYIERKDSSGRVIERFAGKPTKFDPQWYQGLDITEYGENVTLNIMKEGEKPVTKTVATPITYVFGVAYAGEIWMAAGSVGSETSVKAAIAASTDDGDTWKVVWTASDATQQYVMGIVGAPLEDFPPDVRK